MSEEKLESKYSGKELFETLSTAYSLLNCGLFAGANAEVIVLAKHNLKRFADEIALRVQEESQNGSSAAAEKDAVDVATSVIKASLDREANKSA